MSEMIKCRAMIEVLGKPKEHVEQALNGYIERIRGDKNYQVFKSEVYDSEEKEDGFWVTFGELEFSAKDIPIVIGFCFDYMPSVIEILEPTSLVMRDVDISTFINDLQAKLHQVDMIAKQEKSEKIYLKQNLNNLMKNYVRVLLSKGPLTAAQMSKLTGVTQDNLEDFLDVLTDEKMIRMGGDYYHLDSVNEKETTEKETLPEETGLDKEKI